MDFLSSLTGASKPTYSQTLASNLFFTSATTSSSTSSAIGSSRNQNVEQDFFDPTLFLPSFSDLNIDFSKCDGCNSNRTDIWKCTTCNKFFCFLCKFGHQQDYLTKSHHLIKCRIRRHYNSGSLSSSSTESCSPPLSAPLTNVHYCDIHAEPHKLYCEICIKTSCASCCVSLTGACQHRLIFVHEAIENAKKSNDCHKREIESILSEVREGLQKAEINKNNNEKAHRKAQKEIEIKFQSIQNAFASLVQEMLADKREKDTTLTMHIGKLELMLRKMRNISSMLQEAVSSENPWEIMLAKERAARDIRNFKQREMSSIFIEDSEVTFIPPSGDDVMRRVLSLEYRPFQSTLNRVIFGAGKTVVRKMEENTEPMIIGEQGGDEGQLCRPWGVCCNRQGQIIVADRSNDRIQIFNPDGSFLRKFGKHGDGPGELNRPAGVAVNPKGHIIVADKDNHRIQIFTITGEFVHSFGRKGSYPGQFSYPWDVACNSKGQIVVSDSRNHRIQLFDENGSYVRRYGTEMNSSQYRNFDTPRGVCFTPNDEIIVTDFNNHKLLKLDINFEKTTRYIGCEGTESLQFRRPQGVICDDNGNLIIADSKNDRIQVLDYMGNFLWSIGSSGRGPGELDTPSGICLTPEGRIVTVDFGNNRVQIF